MHADHKTQKHRRQRMRAAADCSRGPERLAQPSRDQLREMLAQAAQNTAAMQTTEAMDEFMGVFDRIPK